MNYIQRIKLKMISGLGAVDLFIDDANPFNKAVHSSLGIILAYDNVRFDNILLKKCQHCIL